MTVLVYSVGKVIEISIAPVIPPINNLSKLVVRIVFIVTNKSVEERRDFLIAW